MHKQIHFFNSPSVTNPPTSRCFNLKNLISPPTLSQGPTLLITKTSFGPHFSNASYSGLSPPAGLSCAISGLAGTKFNVTARPQHLWLGWRGRAPSIWAEGQPMTHRPSTRAWVERDPSLARSSSEISPPEAGPVAKALVIWVGRRGRVRRKVEESMVYGC